VTNLIEPTGKYLIQELFQKKKRELCVESGDITTENGCEIIP